MASSLVGTLAVEITADTRELGTNLNQAGGMFDGFGGKIAAVGVIIGGAFAVKKVVDFCKESIEAFSDFESATSHMFATMEPVTPEVKAQTISDIKDISEQFGLLATDITKAYDVAGDVGVPLESMKSFMEPAAQLSKIMGTDVETAARSLAMTIQGLGGDFSETSRVADLFYKVAETGDVDVGTLTTTFAKLLPTAKDLGIGFDELAGYVATLAQQGIPTKAAITDIQGALDELKDPESDVAAKFSELTGKTFPEFIASGGTMSDAINLLAQDAETSGTKLDDLFKNTAAGKAVLLTTGDSAHLLAGNIAEMSDATTGLGTAWAQVSQDTKTKMEQFQQIWNNIKIDLGERLMESLQPLLQWLSEHKDDIKQFFDVFVTVITTALKIAGPLIQGLLDILSAVISLLKGDWSAAWQSFKDYFGSLWDYIKTIWSTLLKPILDALNGLLAGIGDWIAQTWDTFLGWGKGVVDSIVNGLKNAWHAVVEFFQNAWDSLINALTSWMPGFLKKWLGIGQDSSEQYADGLKDSEAAVTGAAQDVAQSAVDQVVITVQGGIGGITTAGEDMGTGLADGLSLGLSDSLPDIKLDLKSFGDGVIYTLQTTLGTHSPSTVTYAIGQDVGQGLADGVSSMQPAVSQIMASMANSISSSLGNSIDQGTLAVLEKKQGLIDALKQIVHETLLAAARELLGQAAKHAALGVADLLTGNVVGASAEGTAAFQLGASAAGLGIFESALPFHSGGIVEGQLGEEVPIIAQAGEMILTPAQQQGLGIDYAKMGEAVAAGVYDAMNEVLPGKERPIVLQLDSATAARALFPAMQREELRLGLVTA